MPDLQTLQTMAARFAPTEIGADLSKLSDNDRRVLTKLVEASKIIDALFLRQVWSGNEAMLLDLARDQSPSAASGCTIPDQQRPLVADRSQPRVRARRAAKPAAANCYPDGASKAEIDAGSVAPQAERSRATGFFTVIRRAGTSFTLVPYRRVQGELSRAAALLRDAARRHRTDAQGLPHQTRGCVSLERLLRATWRGWS